MSSNERRRNRKKERIFSVCSCFQFICMYHILTVNVNCFQKQTWLDIFLAEFLAQIKEGKTVEEILSFWWV